jgi:hypothetical protein
MSYGVGGINHSVYANSDDVAALGSGVLPGAFDSRDDGTVYLAACGAGQSAVVAEFDAAGALVFQRQPYVGFPLTNPTSIAALGDGRAVLLGESQSPSEHGMVMAAVGVAGEIGNFVYTDDLVESTADLAASGGVIHQTTDGTFIVGGACASPAGAYEVVRFSAGTVADLRPDQFLNARTSDIARDSENGLHVAYFDLADRMLKYAYRAPNGLWSDSITVESAINAGMYLSIAVNSNNLPVIAYFVGGVGDLHVATTADRVTFTPQVVDYKGSVGLYPSLAIDQYDRPNVSYYKRTGGDLRYAVMLAPNSWRVETVDSADNVGRGSELVQSPTTHRFTVAYIDQTHAAVKWATRKKANKWIAQTVAMSTGTPAFVSMNYGYYYRPAITWYEAGSADLKLAAVEDGQWNVKTLSSKGAVGQYSAVVFRGFYDPPSVFCYNPSHDAVDLISVDFDHSATLTEVASGVGRYLTVASSDGDSDIAYYDPASNAIAIRKAPPLE